MLGHDQKSWPSQHNLRQSFISIPPENVTFSAIFRGYRNGTLRVKVLMILIIKKIFRELFLIFAVSCFLKFDISVNR